LRAVVRVTSNSVKTTFPKSLWLLSTFCVALGATVAAQAAALVITNITMVGATPRFGVHSELGITNQIQYCTNLSQGWWLALTDVVVTQSPYWFVDVATSPLPQRFYRACVVGPTPDGMALIPAGSFTMGNCMDPDERGMGYELPLHTNYVGAFYMGRNVASWALWQTVYQWATNHGYSFDNPGVGKAGNHPVQNVSWYDCVKWCNARSEMESRVPAYYTSEAQTEVYRSGQFITMDNTWVKWDRGYRLPTEAEWEKAARGGVSGQRFPWGNTISQSQANYQAHPSSAGGYTYDVNPTSGYHPTFNDGVEPYTSPVSYFAPNGYGLYDMAGNVWQWCWDWDGPYSSG
jgi:formylglycine-generating enzyme required for sulfatase activity